MPHLNNVIGAYRESWSRRRLFIPLYLCVRLAGLAVITPALAAIVNLAVALSDQPALTDQDIAMFVLSPVGFVATLGVLSVLLVAEVLGFAVMAGTLRSDVADPWEAGWAALALIVSRIRAMLGFALRLVIRVLLLIAPFAAVAGAIAWWALTEYDINYYLTFRPPAYWVAVGLIGAIALLLAATLIRRLSGWALALHLVLFESIPPARSFGESERRMASNLGRLRGELVWWLILRLILAAVIGVIAGLVLDLVPLGSRSGLRTALAICAVVLVVGMLASLVLAATALGALAALLDGLFDGAVRTPPPTPHSASLGAGLVSAIVVALLALGAGSWMGSRMLDAVSARDEVEIIGHRGAAGARPENTMASIVKAIEDGADWVEIDVQETADGNVVVMHDSDFMKLSQVDLKIWDATMADLDDIDIGSWFDPEFADQRTPTLRDVLAAARGTASRVLIEFKYYGHDEDLENRVVQIVEALGMQEQVAVMSLKYPAVQKMRALRPDWRTGVLAATAVGDMAALEADFIAVNAGMARPGLIRSVQAAGRDFYVWTINDPLEMSKMISMGVDGLITDEPALARQVLAVRAELPPAGRLLLWLSQELGMDLDGREYRDQSP